MQRDFVECSHNSPNDVYDKVIGLQVKSDNSGENWSIKKDSRQFHELLAAGIVQ